jgi:NCAIR mutase (PurE)-related protein
MTGFLAAEIGRLRLIRLRHRAVHERVCCRIVVGGRRQLEEGAFPLILRQLLEVPFPG